MNALKHGLTAANVVLPNEDPVAFQAKLDDWHADFPNAGALGCCLIERAAHASWRLNRCARYETARAAQRVRRAADDFDLQEHTRAESIGRRLLFEAIGRYAAPKVHDQNTIDKLQRRHDDDPAILSRQLQATATGVRWLLDRWEELNQTLDVRQFWHSADMYKAVRLLGRRPEDVLEDPVVERVFLARMGADPTPWPLYDMLFESLLACDAKPIQYVHIAELEKLLPTDPATALATLRAVVAVERDRLRLMLLGLDALDRLDRDEAEARAMFDASEAGVLARRYETASERELHKAIADLLKLKKEFSPAVAPSEPPPSQNEPVSELVTAADVAPSEPAAAPVAKPSRVAPRPRGPLTPAARPESPSERPPDPAL